VLRRWSWFADVVGYDISLATRHDHLPTATHALVHPGRGDGRRRAGHGDASGRVDDGDGVPAAGGRWLVELQARLLAHEARGDERWGRRVKRESRGDSLRLLGG
jgi:hypothetical protein